MMVIQSGWQKTLPKSVDSHFSKNTNPFTFGGHCVCVCHCVCVLMQASRLWYGVVSMFVWLIQFFLFPDSGGVEML